MLFLYGGSQSTPVIFRCDASNVCQEITDGFFLEAPDPMNHQETVTVMEAFEDELYVGLTANETCAVLRYDDPGWTNLTESGGPSAGSPNNTGVSSMVGYQGNLYVGTRNEVDGAEIWRYSSLTGAWEPVMTGGFPGTGVLETDVLSLAVHEDALYAGSRGDHASGAYIYRYDSPDWLTYRWFETWEAVPSLCVWGSSLYALCADFPESLYGDGYAQAYEIVGGTPIPIGGTLYTGDAFTNLVTSSAEAVRGARLFVHDDQLHLGGTLLVRLEEGYSALARYDSAGDEWEYMLNTDGLLYPPFEFPLTIQLSVGSQSIGFEGALYNAGVWLDVTYESMVDLSEYSLDSALMSSTDGVNWTRRHAHMLGYHPNLSVSASTTHAGAIYLGTFSTTGAEVWVIDEQGWSPLTEGVGADLGIWNTITDLTVFENQLYAINDALESSSFRRFSLCRFDGQDWVAVSDPDLGDSRNDLPFSLTLPFITDSPFLTGKNLVQFNNALYLATNNFTGAQVWRYDGNAWTRSNTDGFGLGVTEVLQMVVYNGELLISTSDSTGSEPTKVLRYLGGTEWEIFDDSNFSGYPSTISSAKLFVAGGQLYAVSGGMFSSSCLVFHWDPLNGEWEDLSPGLYDVDPDPKLVLDQVAFNNRTYFSVAEIRDPGTWEMSYQIWSYEPEMGQWAVEEDLSAVTDLEFMEIPGRMITDGESLVLPIWSTLGAKVFRIYANVPPEVVFGMPTGGDSVNKEAVRASETPFTFDVLGGEGDYRIDRGSIRVFLDQDELQVGGMDVAPTETEAQAFSVAFDPLDVSLYPGGYERMEELPVWAGYGRHALTVEAENLKGEAVSEQIEFLVTGDTVMVIPGSVRLAADGGRAASRGGVSILGAEQLFEARGGTAHSDGYAWELMCGTVGGAAVDCGSLSPSSGYAHSVLYEAGSAPGKYYLKVTDETQRSDLVPIVLAGSFSVSPDSALLSVYRPEHETHLNEEQTFVVEGGIGPFVWERSGDATQYVGAQQTFHWTEPGDYTVRVTDQGAGDTFTLPVRVVDTGIVVFVVGGGDTFTDPEVTTNTHLLSIAKTAYQQLISGGYKHEDIHFMLNIPCEEGCEPGDDACMECPSYPGKGYDIVDWGAGDLPAAKEQMEWALTSWAVERGVGPYRPLLLYMLDHGGAETFYLLQSSEPGQQVTVTVEELDAWLDYLQDGCPGEGGSPTCPEVLGTRVALVYDACESGSFVPADQNHLGALNHDRVIVTSAGYQGELAMFGSYGKAFSTDLFQAMLSENLSLGQAYGRMRSPRFYRDQDPRLEDNRDGMSSLPPYGDLTCSLDPAGDWETCLANNIYLLRYINPSRYYMVGVPEAHVINQGQSVYLFVATPVQEESGGRYAALARDAFGEHVYAALTPQGATNPADTVVVELLPADDPATEHLLEYGLALPDPEHPDLFGDLSDYDVTIWAEKGGVQSEFSYTEIRVDDDTDGDDIPDGADNCPETPNADQADADRDGFGAVCDCDDTDLGANPAGQDGPYGSASCTDGVDHDCDGLVDGDDPDCAPICVDRDGDGWGKPGHAGCPMGPEEDCVDDPIEDPEACQGCTCDQPACKPCARCIHPGALEIANDTVDSNCNGEDNCFIATAAFGSSLNPKIDVLRELRDRVLMKNSWGRALVELYYASSPSVAAWIAERPNVAALVRVLLLPVIGTAYVLCIHDLPVGLPAAAGLLLLLVGGGLSPRIGRHVPRGRGKRGGEDLQARALTVCLLLVLAPGTALAQDCYECFGADDTLEMAKEYAVNGTPQQRDFHHKDDVDWVRFHGVHDLPIMIQTRDLGAENMTWMELWGTDPADGLLKRLDCDHLFLESRSMIDYTVQDDQGRYFPWPSGTYYLKIFYRGCYLVSEDCSEPEYDPGSPFCVDGGDYGYELSLAETSGPPARLHGAVREIADHDVLVGGARVDIRDSLGVTKTVFTSLAQEDYGEFTVGVEAGDCQVSITKDGFQDLNLIVYVDKTTAEVFYLSKGASLACSSMTTVPITAPADILAGLLPLLAPFLFVACVRGGRVRQGKRVVHALPVRRARPDATETAG